MKTHRAYIEEQVNKEPKFAAQLAEADREVALAVQLAKLREHRGLSQTEVAQLAGMKQPQIARMESGAYFPALGTLLKLLSVLDGKLELSASQCRLTPTRGKLVPLRR
jgi:transcriptional regulator with XRE-family HTH domain